MMKQLRIEMSGNLKACPMRDGEKNGASLLEATTLTGLIRQERLLLRAGVGVTLTLLLLRGTAPCIDEPIADL